MSSSNEEPAGYLGGAQGPEDDPYKDAASATPTATEDDDVAGFLGGAPGEEDLPSLPGQQQDDASYSAHDFLESEEVEPAENPYADPYADQDDYGDPYALPPSESSPYDEYEGYDAAAMSESDPSYFDSMGHDDSQDVATATMPTGYETEEFTEDDSQPKTISQQDAESIIRRITTKRILPPESQKQVSPPRLTASSGGLRIWPILLITLVLAAGGVYTFRKPIAEAFPQLAGLLGVDLQQDVTVDPQPKENPEEVKKRAMMKMILQSEMKAFDLKKEDLEKAGPMAKKTEGK